MGLKGEVKVDVVDHLGNVVREGRWQPNLLLDQGMNKLTYVLLCDLFAYAVKGPDTTAMKRTISGNKYTLDADTMTVTRTDVTGTAYPFTSADQHQLIRSASGSECIITSITSDMVVAVKPVGRASLVEYVDQVITLYRVNAIGMSGETTPRTDSYSTISGENSTTDVTNVRTLKRTFLFDPEGEYLETGTMGCNWPINSDIVQATVAGSRNFTSDDVGKVIAFAGGLYAQITHFIDNDEVRVDRESKTNLVGMAATIYGYAEYGQIGFSEVGTFGDNLNILVRLEDVNGASSTVRAMGSNPINPGQQVKVTYQMKVTFGPNVKSLSSSSNIDDPGNVMGAKSGFYSLEAIASSKVSSDGSTDSESVGLEPSVGGYIALSTNGEQLVPISTTKAPPDRGAGAQFVQSNRMPYVAGEFSILTEGIFGINQGNSPSGVANWKSLGIYDPTYDRFLFTFLYDNAQKKPGTHQLTVRFRKTWNRDLS